MRLLPHPPLDPQTLTGPLVLRGRLWAGDGTEYDDGRIVVAVDGTIAAVGPAADVPSPVGATEIGAEWIGPGVVDAHVHLAFADATDIAAHGVVAVRDLGAPPGEAVRFRQLAIPRVEIAGPLVTAPTGYPSRSWGSAGFAAYVDDVRQAERLVTGLAAQVDVVKLALEPLGGPVPSPEVAAAVVDAAHAAGRPVTCHALTVDMVERALDAGVDELAHTPLEALPDEVVQRIAAGGVRVISTLQTFVSGGEGTVALANAAALVAAGVEVRYGTDLGNAGTRSGTDPRELRLLEREVGLGIDGALRAATVPVTVGAPAGVVALRGDPRVDPARWREPVCVVVGATLLRPGRHR